MNSEHSQTISVDRAVRFGLASVIVGVSYPNIKCALGLNLFRQIYQDMLNGKPLPTITTFVLHAQPFLIAVSILIPIAAIILMFAGRRSRSFYILGLLIIAAFAQLSFTWQAIAAPIFSIIATMQG